MPNPPTPNPLSKVERLAIHTSDGLGLRAEYLSAQTTADHRRSVVAVVCHPHPLHGGTMHNHVVGTLFTTFASLGIPTLRFNFRGTSGSEGRHGGGTDERLDVLAAIDALLARHDPADDPTGESGSPRVLLSGYSFGAVVALSVDHPAIGGWLAVAPPLSLTGGEQPAAGRDSRPTVIIAGTDDQFTTASDARDATTAWTATGVVPLPGEDHFLATAAGALSAEAEAFGAQLADY